MYGRKSKEEFTLEEGRVLIQYPSGIGAESLDDLRAYLDIFYRKLCRKVGVPFDPLEVVQPQRKAPLRKETSEVQEKLEKLVSVG